MVLMDLNGWYYTTWWEWLQAIWKSAFSCLMTSQVGVSKLWPHFTPLKCSFYMQGWNKWTSQSLWCMTNVYISCSITSQCKSGLGSSKCIINCFSHTALKILEPTTFSTPFRIIHHKKVKSNGYIHTNNSLIHPPCPSCKSNPRLAARHGFVEPHTALQTWLWLNQKTHTHTHTHTPA